MEAQALRHPTRILALALLGLALLTPAAARAQMDSREAIALQNQLLELRRDLDQLRRGGSSLGAPPVAPPPRNLPAGGGELVGALVARVGELEEEVRRLRGRAQEAEFRNQQLTQDIEKLRGDLEFRLDALEGGRGGRPGQRGDARPPAPQPQSAQPAQPQPAAAGAPRPPERALSDGQAALGRRDFGAAEAAAREVIASRNQARSQDAQILLGDALAGRRQFQNAALAYDEAYRRNRQGARAPEALLGLSGAFAGFNARREACDTLDQLRTEFPRLSPGLTDRANAARRSNGCR
jgi:TolA-binding protein